MIENSETAKFMSEALEPEGLRTGNSEPWMAFAGIVATDDPASNPVVDEVVYIQEVRSDGDS